MTSPLVNLTENIWGMNPALDIPQMTRPSRYERPFSLYQTVSSNDFSRKRLVVITKAQQHHPASLLF